VNASKLQRKLASVIKKHCKKRGANEGTNEDYLGDAAYIIHTDRWSVKRQRAWKLEDETARIKKIELALDDAISNIRELPEYLRLVLTFGAERQAAPEGILAALEAIRVGIKSAKVEAASGAALNVHAIGRTGRVRAGAVLWECRVVWKRQTGSRAPRTSNAAFHGPFGEFSQEVFDTLNIGFSVRRALDLVNEQRRKNHTKRPSEP
jgi:hypothetical protein